MMHGMVFALLKKYAEAKLGGRTWGTVLTDAGLPAGRVFLPLEAYPDEELAALVAAVSRATALPAQAVFESFGDSAATDLLRMYGHLLDKQWRTLDVIEHVEETVHNVVRARNPGARPPVLRCRRVSPKQVLITYSSERKMCGFAKGIVAGLARHFGESVSIAESGCMHHGAKECRISVSATG